MNEERMDPHDSARRPGDADRQRRSGRDGDFQAALGRLERVVGQLVGSAKNEFSDRAATLLDETTTRLQQELGRRGRPAPAERELRQAPIRAGVAPVSRELARDRDRAKIGGVCAGIARYYGLEPWVVRCVAVTALLFYPGIVFPAYWIGFFVMGTSGSTARHHRRRDGHRHGGRADDAVAPAPELGPRLSPRRGLRNVQADLTEVELRLRRMETHVTSGRYELQRELHKIDGGASA